MQLSNWAQLLNYDVLAPHRAARCGRRALCRRRREGSVLRPAVIFGALCVGGCPPPHTHPLNLFARHQTLLFPSALRHRRRSDGPVGCSAMRRCGCSHCFVLGPIHICCFMSSTCIFGIFMCTFIFLVTVRLFAGVGA